MQIPPSSPRNNDPFNQSQGQILPQFVSIDESWVSDLLHLKAEFLICPICYNIPLDYPMECVKCERIFCEKCYQKVRETDDKCPTCKASPWRKKDHLHIAYKNMFNSLKLKCKYCLSEKEMNKEEIVEHLENHNMYLSEESILYDYAFVSVENNIELKLNLMQNLEMNVRRASDLVTFEIGGPNGKVLAVNLKDMEAQHPTLGKCRIIKSKTKTLKRNKEYMVWSVDISDKEMQMAGERYVFYSEEFQGIIEKNYQDYLKNERLNEFCLDVRDTRFRISFWDMTQTNTYSKSEKPIFRHPVVLK